MALATLSVDLVAKLAKFEGDMGKAARASEQASQRIVSSLGVVKATLGGLAAGITFAGIIDMGRAAINSVDALNDLRDATGASIENISALEDVAARTGTSFETVQASLIKFNTALKDAKPGSDAEAAFKALGLSVQELKTLDPAQALLKTSQALASFADDGNKARLTQELFGKSTKDVAAFLKDLAEKGKLVGTVTQQQTEEAEKFNKALFGLQKNSQDATRALLSGLVPALNEILAIYNNGGLAKAVDEIGNKLFDWEGNQSRKNIQNIKNDLKSLQEQSNLITVDVFGSKGKLAQQIEAKTAELAKATSAYLKISDGSAGGGRGKVNPAVVDGRVSLPATFGGKDKTLVDPLIKAQEAALQSLREQLIGVTEDTGEFDKVVDRLVNGSWKNFNAETAAAVLAMAGEIDEQKQSTEAKKQAAKAIDDATKSAQQYLQSIAKEMQTMEANNQSLREHVQEIGLSTVSLNELRLARLDAALATEEQTRAQMNLQNSSEAEIAAMERRIQLLREQRSLTASGQIAQTAADTRDKAAQASKDFADTLNNDLKGAFSAAFRDTSGEPLKAFGDAIANVIYSRAATALADSLLGSVSGSSAGGDAGALFLSKLFSFSFDGGGSTGMGPRSGGLDGKGGFMAMLHPKETVLDHTKGQRSGGGVTVVQNFTVGDVASVSLVRQAVAGSERRIAASMGRSMNYGGALA